MTADYRAADMNGSVSRRHDRPHCFSCWLASL